MGRTRTIDRDKVLDAAETIVRERGAAALTIDAVAKAVGITKGGVQYCFGSKDELVRAMIERWSADYTAQVEALVGKPLDPINRLRGHLEITAKMDQASLARAAGMLAVLGHTRDELEQTRAWYRPLLADLDVKSKEGRRARLAFFATDGAFLLRSLGFLEIPAAEWDDIFEDIRSLLFKAAQPRTKPREKT